MKQEERKLLIKIARMYYEQDMTQSEISKELGIYRTTISRMLKKVREKGIVKITINYDEGDTVSLEEQLKTRYNLKEAIVVPISNDTSEEVKLKVMGQACARFLQKIIKNDAIIGFSWGSSLAAVVDALESTTAKNVTCVPLVGGPFGRLEAKYHVNTLCYQAAQTLQANSIMIDVPAIVGKKETRDDIVSSQYLQEIAAYWNKLTIALFGIGSAYIQGKETWQAFYGEHSIQELENGKVVGDICSRFYDQSGRLVETSISDRTITIEMQQLLKTNYRIGVAESAEKVKAIIGALNGGIMNVFVTTEETAQQLVNMKD